jgi:uncharacterized membrane protein YeiH
VDIEAGATLPSLPLWSSYAAVTVGGVAGASYAARRGFDVIGVLGLAVASGLGGLLLRDVLLMKGTPVVLTDPRYLLSASIAALVGFLFAGIIARLGGLLLALDALAMGLFVSLGAVAAFYYQLGVPAAIFLAVTTAIGGSILRDVLSGEPPAVMRPGIFSGIAALFGALVFVTLDYFGVATFWNQVATIAAVAGMRWLALWRKWESQSSEDFMGRIEDLLSKAAQPLASLPIAPAARARINSDDLSAEFTTSSAMPTTDASSSGSGSGSHGERSTTEDTQPARSENTRHDSEDTRHDVGGSD